MNLNFNGTTVAEIYNNEISNERIQELVAIFKHETGLMVDQHDTYTVMKDDGAGAGEEMCVFRGKVMQRLLEFTNTEYERMFIAHSVEKIIDYLNKAISHKILRETIEEKFK